MIIPARAADRSNYLVGSVPLLGVLENVPEGLTLYWSRLDLTHRLRKVEDLP